MSDSPERARRAWQISLAVFAIFFAVEIFFQWLNGAYRSEFGGHPDEAAHYVTGLMVRDYLAHGCPGSPMRFAQNYYEHYPKVALGNWPPLFYVVQAAWTLPFSPSRVSVMLLMAVLASALALVFFETARAEMHDALSAFCGAVLLLALPLIQQYSSMVMAEMLTALTMFGAAIFFGRFLEREKTGDAVAFGLCAAAAILVKGNGVALALVPPIAIAAARKFHLLKFHALWLAALLVVVLAGPWTYIFRNAGRGGWEEASLSWHFTRNALGYYSWRLVIAFGFLLSALAIVGLAKTFFGWQFAREKVSGVRIASAALIVAIYIFQAIMPVGYEARHLIPALPAVMLFAMIGVDALARPLSRELRPAAFALVLALFFLSAFFSRKMYARVGYGSLGEHAAFSPFRVAQKGFIGLGSLAEFFFQKSPQMILKNGANPQNVLVSSDARGEGMFIAEAAMRDPHRPDGCTIQRASKLLATSTWSGSGYQAFFEKPEDVLKILRAAKTHFVVLDDSVPNPKPHQQLLRATAEGDTKNFTLIQTSPMSRDGRAQPGSARLYSLSGSAPAALP